MTYAKKLTPTWQAPSTGRAGSVVGGTDLSEMSLRERVAFLRGHRGMSQRHLGELVGRSESWLAKVERGERPCTNIDTICRLASALRVPPAMLFDFDVNAMPEGSCPDKPPESGGGARRGPSVMTAGWATGIRQALDGLSADPRRLQRTVERIGTIPMLPLDGGQDEDATVAWLVVPVDAEVMAVPLRLPRRALLAAGGAALLAGLGERMNPDELGRVVAAEIAEPSRADLPLVTHLEALLDHHRRLDDVIGPRDLNVGHIHSIGGSLVEQLLADVVVADFGPPMRVRRPGRAAATAWFRPCRPASGSDRRPARSRRDSGERTARSRFRLQTTATASMGHSCIGIRPGSASLLRLLTRSSST